MSRETATGGQVLFPETIDPSARAVRFRLVRRDQLSEAPFLDERWDRTGLEARFIAPFDQGSHALTTPPRFIWHTAFCCSTLLARCLDKPAINLSLKEPSVLMEIANIRRAQGETAADGWLRSIVPALTGLASGEGCVTIKPTNAANNLISSVARLFPDARHLCLTSDIERFLLSIARKGETGRAFARRLFSIFSMDGHPVAGMDPRQLMKMTDLQVAALVWHMQIAAMLAALQRPRAEGRFASLDCDRFLRDPAATLARVDDFFDLRLGRTHTEAATGTLFRLDAKNTGQTFSQTDWAEEARRVADSLGADLDAIVQWSYSLFPGSPANGRLPHALSA